MDKRPEVEASGSLSDSLRAAADRILTRANALAVPPAKDRAFQLALIVLRNDPNFGGQVLNDDEILAALKAERIGIATFRKALTEARRELGKSRRASPSKRAKSQESALGVSRSAIVPPATEKMAPTSSVVEARDRTLL